MDYDENDAQEHNLHLTGEGSSKVSPVLHSYPLPRFDFDDNLQEHLRFDSLVENEVFLGITGQEDNQWIEEYSREPSAIPFNSSVAESRNQNVWSEATSSESVEMLLKSVGQEEKVLEETMVEELDPIVKHSDGNQETETSHEGIDSVAVGDTDGLSTGEEKVDKTCDDANQEGSSGNLANEMQEDTPAATEVECENVGSIQNVDASVEECQNNPLEVSETLNENTSDKACDDTNQEGSDLGNEYFVTELQEDSIVSNVKESVEVHEMQNENASDKVNEMQNEIASDQVDEMENESANDKVDETQNESASDKVDNMQNENPSDKGDEMQNEDATDVSKDFHICEDANKEVINLGNESVANELQEDLSVSKLGGGTADSSQNVDASIEKNTQEILETPNENTTDPSQNLNSSEPVHIEEIHDDANKEDITSANELQQDPSVSKLEDASIEECVEDEHATDVSKNLNSSESEHVDKLSDDANQKDTDLGSESLVNELHENLSENAQNVDESIEEFHDNHTQEVLETVNENASEVDVDNTEPLVNELQEDTSVSNVENVGTTSIEPEMPTEDIINKDEGAENDAPDTETQPLEPDAVVCMDSDVKVSNLEQLEDETQSSEPDTVVCMDSDVKISNLEQLEDDTQSLEPDAVVCMDSEVQLEDETQPLEPDADVSMDQDFTFSERGIAKDSYFTDMDIDVVVAHDTQKNDEPSSENNDSKFDTGDSNQNSPVKISDVDNLGDETQPLEPDTVCKDQDFTFNKRGDTSTLTLDSKDTDMDADKAPDSQTNVEPSLSVEVSEETIVMAQVSQSEPSISLVPDAVAENVEPSKVSSPEIVTEEQPRSPILGVSLLHEEKVEVTVARLEIDSTETQPPIPEVDLSQNDNEGKEEVEGSFQKPSQEVVDSAVNDDLNGSSLPAVKKDADSLGDVDVGPSEQTVDDNPRPLDTTTSLPVDSLTKEVNNESITGEDVVEPLTLTVNISNEQQASVITPGPPEHEKEDASASFDKRFEVFSFTDTKTIEFTQISKDKNEVTKGTMENTPLNEVDVLSSSATKQEQKGFTFEVITGQPGTQNLDFSKVPVPSVSSTAAPLLDFNKPNKDSQITPQPPSEPTPKKTTERKPRRKSVGKETPKKTPTKRSGAQKSTASITSPTTPPNQTQQPDLNHPSPIPIPILHQSFTDNQQVQLRAQILVYGSLISGTSPEEPHMIAAFGQSDAGRKAWEAAWRACIERVHSHKSQVNNPQTPLHLRSGQESKIDSVSSQSKVVSTPIITGSVVSLSPMNPISTPLWNISTPHDRLQSNPTPRTPCFDYRQNLSPLHSFQTQQRVQQTQNPAWPSNQWVASLPVSPFAPRFSPLPITEAVKLTTVKEPVDPTPSPIISPIILPSSQQQPSNESKSRKRKKETGTGNVVMSQTQTPVPLTTFLTPVSVTTPKTNAFLSALTTPGPSQTRVVDRNVENTVVAKVAKDETLSKIEESKLQATEAAENAAVAVKNCQDLWSQLERQKGSGLLTEDEAKLASSAVSISAAASVAKVAAFAAKIASNVAEQARLMADEVFLSTRTESTHTKSTLDHSNPVLSVAREAARRRVEAASAASKHAENLDAVVKAAELAAEAVSQAGKIVAMGKPLSLSELVDAGPDSYWKTPQKQNVVGSGSSGKKIQTLKHGLSLSFQEDDDHSGDLVETPMVVTSYEKDKSKTRVPELGIGYGQDVDLMQESRKDGNIAEGCLVEVYKEDNKKGAWYAANVLALNDGKAFVCYTEIPSDDGSGKKTEWVPLEAEGNEAPRVRLAHPMTTLRFEGTKKRGRTVLNDYDWSSGDHVDVWVHDSWQEAIVVETNKIDLTSITVQFPAQGKTTVVRSWHVRPTLVFKDGKWIEWSSSKGHRSSEGDTPQEKRQKFDKEKEKPWNGGFDLEPGRNQETRIPKPLMSTEQISFNVGNTNTISMDNNKHKTRGPIRSGNLQKERSRAGVVFGVPKPGKKQKFMDVSRHYVGDTSNKNLNPPPPKKIFVNDSVKQVVVPEATKPKQQPQPPPPKFRKPPVPTVSRTLPQKLPGQQRETGVGGGSSSSNDVSLNNTPKQSSVKSKSKVVVGGSEPRVNKRKLPYGNVNKSKIEVKENLTSESEPRRSNRKIQPTSRLLEGLQSSLTISKMPTVSKVMSKGSPRPG